MSQLKTKLTSKMPNCKDVDNDNARMPSKQRKIPLSHISSIQSFKGIKTKLTLSKRKNMHEFTNKLALIF